MERRVTHVCRRGTAAVGAGGLGEKLGEAEFQGRALNNVGGPIAVRGGNPIVFAQRVGGADFGGFLADARIEVTFIFALAEKDAGFLVAHAALHEHLVKTKQKLWRMSGSIRVRLHHGAISF